MPNQVCSLCRIALDKVNVVRGGQTLLQDVSMHIHCGQLTVLIGQNGAGKTTLIRALLGELPHGGAIRHVDDHGRNIPRLRTGYVPQHLDFDKEMPVTVEDFMAAAFTRRPVWTGVSRRTREKVRVALRDVNGEELLKRPLGRCSGGELQRVLLALAISPAPDLLVLDEPAAGLDPQGRHTIFQGIREYNRNTGCTVLIVSHSMEDMAQYCDDVVVMAHAKVLMAGDRDHVFARADELEAVGLDIPQITKLCLLLREGGMPMPAGLYTVDSAEDALVKLFSEARGKGGKRV